MNDANIRMTDKISQMNDLTVTSMQEAQKAQSEYITAADGYLKSIKEAQTTLVEGDKDPAGASAPVYRLHDAGPFSMKSLTLSTNTAFKEMSEYFSQFSKKEEEQNQNPETDELKKVVALLEAQEKRGDREAESGRGEA